METKNPLISIIVPVYKVEKHIERCIQSILAQTYQNFELILVDDGSPDNSGKICDDYAQKDSRIKVIHKQNGGVSAARNTGIEAAKGEYIVFVDSDDWVESDHIYNLIPESDEDLVCCGIKFIKNGAVIDESKNIPTVVGRNVWKSNFLGFWKKYGILSPCRCMYKSEIINKQGLIFDTNFSIGEDELFNLTYIRHCVSIRYTDKQTYCYDVGDFPSLMKRFHDDRMLSSKQAAVAIESITEKSEYGIRWYYWHWAISHYEKWLSNKEVKKKAKAGLKRCYKERYYRESISYIRKNGTLDEKVETYFMGYYLHKLYKPFYSVIKAISRLKNKIS